MKGLVEWRIAWLVGPARPVPACYRGVAANNWWLPTRAAALNLRRLLSLGLTAEHGTWNLRTA